MNILISTTTNWNPGDDFLRIAVKNILGYVFPNANYIHYDRNPNNFIDYPNDQNMKVGLFGTFMNSPIDFEKIDLVVLAGTPEFLHEPLSPIYNGLLSHPNIPLWLIGVGYSEPKFVKLLTDTEKEILSRESTLIITRQRELSIRLTFELIRKKIFTLPCPALFCFDDYPEKTKEELNTDDAYINTDPYDVLRIIGEHKRIFTNRLHGAIAGISSGAYVKLNNDSFRVKEAMKLFDEVIECNERAVITTFKVKALSQYLNIFNEYTTRNTIGKSKTLELN